MEPYPIACFGCHIDRKSSMHDLTYVKRQTRKRMKQLEIHRWVRSIFCIALFLSWIPFLQAQEKRLIDLELNEVPLSTALRQLEREGGKNILFVSRSLPGNGPYPKAAIGGSYPVRIERQAVYLLGTAGLFRCTTDG